MKNTDKGLIDEGLIKLVNERVSTFLRDERVLKGRSVRTVARKLKIKRKHIKSWESGRRSPPAYLLFALARFYGKEAFFRLHQLDFDLQMEKYERTKLTLAAASVSKAA